MQEDRGYCSHGPSLWNLEEDDILTIEMARDTGGLVVSTHYTLTYSSTVTQGLGCENYTM